MDLGNLRFERGAALVEYILLVAIGGLTALAVFTSLLQGIGAKVNWMIYLIRTAGP